MRPYTLHKDQDGKYIQPSISQVNVIQPSPLALLAATCSKIGQTVPEDVRSFSQGKAGTVAVARSCSEQLKSSPFVYLDRSSDSLKSSPPITPAGFQSPYFKVKQEESADYNQNYEGVHICPSVFHDSRLTETQKAFATSSCGHRARGYAASCEHVVENHEFFTANIASTSCDQSSRYTRLQSHEQQNFGASLAVDQFGMPDQGFFGQGSQASSCAYDNQVFQGSALANLSSMAPACSMPEFDTSLPAGFSSQGERNVDITASWSQSLRDIRDTEVPVSSKPSCLMSDRSPHLHHMPPQSHISTPRRGLSHVSTTVQPSQEATATGICQQQFFSQHSLAPAEDSMTSSQNFHGALSQASQHIPLYPGYSPRSGDFKHNSYIQHPHPNFRTAPPLNVGTMHPSAPLQSDYMYQSHSLNEQRLKWRYPEQVLPGIVRQHPSPTGQANLMLEDALNLRMLGSGNPMQIGDYCSSSCSSPPSSMQLPSPSVPSCGIGASHTGEVQDQALGEYQYQQQQMFYARDNRRPRRIACTCPNCRDGDNKSVTTKDGKQRKLHVCHVPGCGKIYGKTSHLRAHLRWHAGERPFACNWLFCNKRFTRSDELQRHRRTHTGDKRFQCRTCLKKFMRSDHLSKHMKTHLLQQKASKVKDDSDSASDAVSASSDESESGDLGTQLKEILNDSPCSTASK